LPLPSYQQLQQLRQTVIAAADDACPLLSWPGIELRRFQGFLYALAPLPAFDANRHEVWQGDSVTIAGAGCLSSCKVVGAGLVMGDYQLRFRQGGERMRPAGRGGSRSLKKILQELALPPWLRDRVPLIYAGDELVAVADLLIAEGWQAKGDSEGWQLQWQWQRGLYE
jgi:tRNA(Ile)-lysidine synthase